jgi:hypothetical protein
VTARHADTASVLGRLLKEKIALFKDLNSATGDLCESFARQDFNKIEALIAGRGELAARIDSLDREIMDLSHDLRSLITDLDAPERDCIRALVGELQESTRIAVDLDNTCTAAASKVFESLGSDISRMRQEKHSFNSYSGQNVRTKILDVKT